MKLRLLSLFSGCGGMDIGFEGGFICHRKSVPRNWINQGTEDWVELKRTGFDTVFANDIMKEAKLAWNQYMNRPDVYHLDSIVDIVKAHNNGEKVFPDNIDIVTGGFPCQDFSVAGKRKGFDSAKSHNGEKRDDDTPSEETRGKLYFWMKQVIDIVKPKMFIAENVKGLVSLGDVKDIIQKDFASADGNGYIVFNPKVLHAGDYGVPETRERVFFIGVRKDALRKEALEALESENIPQEYNPYPEPTHRYTTNNEALLPPVTCRDVFGFLKEPEESNDASQQKYSKARYLGKHSQGQSEIKLDGLGPTIRSEHHGNIEYRRLSLEHGGKYADELARGLIERRLTPRECALIQTFPPDYTFVSCDISASSAYKVIGNAVPPVLAYNIAQRLQQIWGKLFTA